MAQAKGAFGVQLNEYRVGNQVLRAPATAPSVPSSLAGLVRGVLGLDELAFFLAASTAMSVSISS